MKTDLRDVTGAQRYSFTNRRKNTFPWKDSWFVSVSERENIEKDLIEVIIILITQRMNLQSIIYTQQFVRLELGSLNIEIAIVL